MVEHLPDHVIADLARRHAAGRFAQDEAVVRESLINHVERAFIAKAEVSVVDPYAQALITDVLRGMAETAVDALADFVDSGSEFVEPWHGRASTHG